MTEAPNARRDRRRTSSSPRVGSESSSDAVIVCDNLVKIFKTGDLEVVALQGLDLVVDEGEFVAIVGASGSGKSTLLNIIGGLEVPSAGRAVVAGHDLLSMTSSQRTGYRRDAVGFVSQQTASNLLPFLTAAQNVETPMLLAGVSKRERRTRAADLLDLVGLHDRTDHRPHEMSGGEQQRVAIAAALANTPRVVLADEPTGELDTTTSAEVFELLQTLSRERGVSVIVVTHDPLVADHVSRTVAIRDGRTSSEVLRRSATSGDGALVAEEFAVLDRAGRLQLPEDYIDEFDLKRRVRLGRDIDHINVFPDRERDPE